MRLEGSASTMSRYMDKLIQAPAAICVLPLLNGAAQERDAEKGATPTASLQDSYGCGSINTHLDQRHIEGNTERRPLDRRKDLTDRLYWQAFGQRIAILGAAGQPRAAIEAEVSRTMRRVNSEWDRASKGGPYETLPQVGGSSVAVRRASRHGGVRLHSLPAAQPGMQLWRRRLVRTHAVTVVLKLAAFGLAITAAAMIPHATPQQAGIVAAVLPFCVACASRLRRAPARVIEMPRRAAEWRKAA